MKNVKASFDEWDELNAEIVRLFKEKNNIQARVLVEKGIELFREILFFSNGSDILSLSNENIGRLKYKPVNSEERISFVKAHPERYHSFAVLAELMNEQKKLYYKSLITKKTPNP